VHESVELVKRAKKRSAVPFTNAVLRKFSGTARGQDWASAIGETKTSTELASFSAHPSWLVERWIQEYGFKVAQNICAYDQRIPETSVGITDAAIANEINRQEVHLSPGHLLASAYRVVSGDLTSTPSFREGRVVIQDEASQLVALLVGKGSNILDCCAAPGGKTRIIAERNPNAAILAAELHPHRAQLLRRLVPAKNIQVVAADACGLPVSMRFDRVLADVPCSGTGTLARNPEIKWRLKPEDLSDFQTRQLAILQAAMKHVASGGRVIYSTCSLEREENSQVVERAIASDSSFRMVDCRAELQQLRSEGDLVWSDLDSLVSGEYLRTIPGVHPCDGFFAAILQKS